MSQRKRARLVAIQVLVAIMALGVPLAGCTQVNQITDREKDDGWILLFDGKTLENWKGYQQAEVPDSWKVVDGTLHFAPDGERGDVLTTAQFENFELSLEWRISENGNSGIMFGVSEDHDRPYETGPEMQVLDNDGHADGKNPLTSAGSNYALHAPLVDATRPVGSWNQARIIVDRGAVEHWLNEQRVVVYQLGSDEWNALVAGTKFAEMPGYGLNRRGHIALQDHGDPVWYRNIKIKNLGTS